MLRAIREELKRTNNFTFSVAFITSSAIAMLKQALLDYKGSGCIITSTYLGFNSPDAFRELLNLKKINIFLHPDSAAGFHAKGYIFEQDSSTTAIVGSTNLTERALLLNHEWNLRFSSLPNGDIVDQLKRAVQAHKSVSIPLSKEWIEGYERTWSRQIRQFSPKNNQNKIAIDASAIEEIQPNEMQREALAEIAALRKIGEKKAVVISATGTGKTILSALDVRSFAPKRMLFIVHREQILDRAIVEFKRVLNSPDSDFGKFVGGKQEINHRYVFASIQSISRSEVLELIDPVAFDYVLIDEVHRAGAASYRKVINYLKPAFLLGMTATPERTDDFNVFELFDFNVPYEIRLQKALEADMLSPFHYYGVTDFEMKNGEVLNEFSELRRLVADERVDHLIKSIEIYGHAGEAVKGLIFCSKNDEAAELSNLLNCREIHGKKIRTISLSGQNSVEEREKSVHKLEIGELDYIVTVDIFNEGIDIPSVNQVIMLRQTLSSIVFTQQLGRGLRKAEGKSHLVVIDFIGNYDNNYLIPIALFGDSSLNKDSIRKKIIDAQESGAIAGLSSVNFDAISKERIYNSLATTTLDSMSNLKKSFVELENRLGRTPRLIDFARFNLVDPVVIATKQKNYWKFQNKIGATEVFAEHYEDSALTMLTTELLNGKRPHELLLIKDLLANDGVITKNQFCKNLDSSGLVFDDATINSVIAVLSLEFFTEAEANRYGATPIVEKQGENFSLNQRFLTQWRNNEVFNQHVQDLIDTGLHIARTRNKWSSSILIGERYSRKDVCRLLNWNSNQQSTIYGYKVDDFSHSCPIFVTYHKSAGVSESTKYEDEFLNQATLKWFTRSRRTLASNEVHAIVENHLPLYIFAKKDDAEGTDFFYLGTAKSSNAIQTKMAGDGGDELDVVTMLLHLETPIETSLYEYFQNRN